MALHIGTSGTLRAFAGVLVASCLSGAAPALASGAGDQVAAPAALAVTPSSSILCAGETVHLVAARGKAAQGVTWRAPQGLGSLVATSDGTAADYTAPPPIRGGPAQEPSAWTVGAVTITAVAVKEATGQDEKAAEETATATITLAGACDGPGGGLITRFTVGYEQVGAAGTDSSHRYSFDVFISRPLPFGGGARNSDSFYFGPRARWWGDVRLGSYPQQVDSEVAAFAASFANNLGKVHVNKLVQSAEFQTGLEVRLAASAVPLESITEDVRHRFMLTALVGYGGIGPLPPVEGTTVFQAPTDPSSPAGAAFKKAFPDVSAKYVVFVPPGFLRQWSVGLRLYSFSVGRSGPGRPSGSAPATVELTVGKNELVSSKDLVVHASAYYPYAFGDRTDPTTPVVYFFGDAVMAARHGRSELYLPAATDSAGKPIPLSDPGVAVLPVLLNNRDTYRIGAAIDLLRLWKKLTSPSGGGKS